MPATDLIQAVIDQLESNSVVMIAFGGAWDQTTGTGTPKFYADMADDVPLPYCVISEVGETYDYMTQAGTPPVINFTAPGQMLFSIFAPTRALTRSLGLLVAGALNDAAMSWTGGLLMEFRLINSRFQPIASVGPQAPAVFNRVFLFEYMYSGSL